MTAPESTRPETAIPNEAAPDPQQRVLRVVTGHPTGDDQGAPTRTHAREASAQSQQPSATAADVSKTAATRSARARLVEWAHPPNVHMDRPPSWQEIKDKALSGEHLPDTGWPRTLGMAWARCVTLPVRVVCLYADWISQSLSRTGAAFLVYALLAHLAPLAWLPWPGFLP